MRGPLPTLGPLSRPLFVAAAGGGSNWWEAGGATGIIAAWQPKGAASYSASKSNMANPGTHDATDIAAPAWNATDGWVFSGSHALDSTIVPAAGQTVIVQFTGMSTSGEQSLIGHYLGDSARLQLGNSAANKRLYAGASFSLIGSSVSSGNLAVAVATAGYYNGSLETTSLAGFSGTAAATMTVGARRREDSSSIDVYSTCKIQALAVYSTLLNSTKIAAVAAAMAAL